MWNEITLTGFADEIAPELSEQIRVLNKLAISHIEMRGVNGKGLVDHTIPEAAEIKKILDAEGFRLSSVGSPIGKISIEDDFEPHLEKLKHTCEIAHTMDVDFIRMFSFYIPEGKDPGEYKGKVFEQTGRMVDLAKAQGIVLLHENEKGIYGDVASRCLELMQEFYGEHYKAVFDFANFVQCGQDTLSAYDMLKDYIEYIHIKDALKESGSVVPAGDGDGNVEVILKKLKESGYHGFLSLEPHLADFGGFSALENGQSIIKRKLAGEEAFTLACESLQKILERI